MKNSARVVASVILLLVSNTPQIAIAQQDQNWEYGLAINGWFPDISGTTTFGQNGGSDISVPIGDILDNLEFTLQGAFDVRKGQWGFATDFIYMDLANSRSNTRTGTIGGTQIPTGVSSNLEIDLTSLILTGAGYYRFFEEGENRADFLFGARYIDMDQKLTYSFSGEIGQLPLQGPQGSRKASTSNFDFIVGLRGNAQLGENSRWFFPYYIDLGTGDSDFTWQASAGIGYTFDWGELRMTYRHLDYDLASGNPFANADFSGPSIGARWSW